MTSFAPPVVFDTNSLWNFASVGRLDVIETRYDTRASWTETVAKEVSTSAAWDPCLTQVSACAWLGQPIPLQDANCLTEVARIQRILAGPGDPPSKNLGEAECIHVIEHELSGNAWFVTDDRPAGDLARKREIRVLMTPDVLVECHHMGELPCPDPYELLVGMAAAGRDNVEIPANHKAICP